MATSGTYSFAVTRDDIIRQSLLNIGDLDPYESPDPQKTTDISWVLNGMVKQWMGKSSLSPGLKVWSRKHGHLFLSSTTGQYLLGPSGNWANSYVSTTLNGAAAANAVSVTLASVTGVAIGYSIGIVQTDGSLVWATITNLVGSVATIPNTMLTVGASGGAVVFVYPTAAQNPVSIESINLRDIQNNDIPINFLRTVQDWDILPSKQQTTYLSDPVAAYVEFQLGNSFLYVDCGACQDVTKHLVISYMEPIQDFNNPLDNPYYPQEYFLALSWGLSKLIHTQYNRIWTESMQINWQLCTSFAFQKDAEVTTLFFQPGLE